MIKNIEDREKMEFYGKKSYFILLDSIEVPEHNMIYIFHWSP